MDIMLFYLKDYPVLVFVFGLLSAYFSRFAYVNSRYAVRQRVLTTSPVLERSVNKDKIYLIVEEGQSSTTVSFDKETVTVITTSKCGTAAIPGPYTQMDRDTAIEFNFIFIASIANDCACRPNYFLLIDKYGTVWNVRINQSDVCLMFATLGISRPFPVLIPENDTTCSLIYAIESRNQRLNVNNDFTQKKNSN